MPESEIEDIYHVLFDTIAEGLLIADKEGKIVMANPSVHSMFGYEQGELIGEKVEKLIPPEARDVHVKHRSDYHDKPRKRQMGRNRNLHAVKKNGELFQVEVSLNHFNKNNHFLVAAIVTDVTERVKQQKEIQELNRNLEEKVKKRTKEVFESQKLYSAIATNFPNGTINVFDEDLNYLFVEGLELAELGIDTSKLIGTSYLDKIAQKLRPKLEKELREAFKGSHKDFELKHQNAYYRINAVPLSSIGETGKIDKILVVEENITQQKMIEKQREEALQKEKQLNEMKSRFVSMASHEFRTPLSTVLSSVSLIEKYIELENFEKTEKHIGRIKNSVANLTEILNDFLSVEKLESNKSSVDKIEFNFNDFLNDVIEELKVICKKDQHCKVDFIEGDSTIISDPKILKNVLYNLISNAIKYSGEGKNIYISTSLKENKLHTSIKDEGIGIPTEDQQELFGRFFRAKNASNIKGTGLGLNIVKRYLDLLKGDITFESTLGEGSTFNFYIPIK
ncbi:PAS domain-containing sensor histidine kinase [Paracrocinitomix mangrovi]|uniref:sensor histidine kinase n=1 Tax=Paracrocinitomix mangrovi TaxID=2862509 RepID=UPI001C8E8F93|nr:ATP-binding protein [Paracrocinitomix mangrovi]UKN01484.1 PAS domain-containing sensor histidine kinase [Paracrocinitomix mangrovi]